MDEKRQEGQSKTRELERIAKEIHKREGLGRGDYRGKYLLVVDGASDYSIHDDPESAVNTGLDIRERTKGEFYILGLGPSEVLPTLFSA